jgi:hypothetical protein
MNSNYPVSTGWLLISHTIILITLKMLCLFCEVRFRCMTIQIMFCGQCNKFVHKGKYTVILLMSITTFFHSCLIHSWVFRKKPR